MKKTIFSLLLVLIFCGPSFAESYYFNNCNISENVKGSYTIDVDQNLINVTLTRKDDGTQQKFSDPIELIGDEKVVSKKIKSSSGENIYFQYYLNSKAKSITKQTYVKQSEFFSLDGPVTQSFCADVKADWDQNEIDDVKINKEQKEILEAEKKALTQKSSIQDCQGNDSSNWTGCEGSFKSQDGSILTGSFRNGKIFQGIALYPGGAKYIGKFKNNKPEGQGTFEYSDGSKYFGDWVNGKNFGNGTKVWSDGKKYAGKFKNDLPHGVGTFTYPDGEEYVGEFKNGKRHGKAKLTYSDGRVYIGRFAEGLSYGIGVCMDEKGSALECSLLKKDSINSEQGKNRKNVSIEARKWIKLPEYESNTGKGKKVVDLLESDFNKKAIELCAAIGKFRVLEKRMDILEIDETPAFGLEPKIKLGISGVVNCE